MSPAASWVLVLAVIAVACWTAAICVPRYDLRDFNAEQDDDLMAVADAVQFGDELADIRALPEAGAP